MTANKENGQKKGRGAQSLWEQARTSFEKKKETWEMFPSKSRVYKNRGTVIYYPLVLGIEKEGTSNLG